MKKFALMLLCLFVLGCGKPKEDVVKYPVFTLLWSEYPSWSAFDVAGSMKIINPEEGAPYSMIENRYGVDIVLKRRDYLQSLKEYASGLTDAVCVTNIDCLNLVKGRQSTAILPTSTSYGADGILARTKSIQDLKKIVTYGAEDSVSEYVFYRGLEKAGEDPKEYQFKHMEPDAAAIALQNGDEKSDVQSIAVWQPFLLQTLRTTDGSTNLLFDSSNIELEVVDMVLVGNDVLKREKGEDFAKAVAKTFYSLCELIQAEKYQKDIIVNIGKKFCNLNYDDMKIVLNKCVFFDTPEAGGVFYKEEWKDKMSNIVVPTSIKIGLIKKEDAPTIGFDDPSKDLNFTMEYLRR
jgi:hypothetical protein